MKRCCIFATAILTVLQFASYTFAGDLNLDISSIVVDEITLVGSRCGPFKPALDLLERGLVDPRPLITARFPLHEGEVAMEQAGQPGEVKVILECWDPHS